MPSGRTPGEGGTPTSPGETALGFPSSGFCLKKGVRPLEPNGGDALAPTLATPIP